MTKSPHTTRTISHAEARSVARRLIAGSFRRDGERHNYDVGPRFSIPTRPDHDDDCLIVAYTEQREAADLVAAHTDEEARLADENILVRPPVTGSLRVGGESWVDTLRRYDLHGLVSDGDTWRDAAYALAAALDEQTTRADRLEGGLYRMSLDELVALRERMRNCTEVVVGKPEATS